MDTQGRKREFGNYFACTGEVWAHLNSKRWRIVDCLGTPLGAPRIPSISHRQRSDWFQGWALAPGWLWDRVGLKSRCFPYQDRIPSMPRNFRGALPACITSLPCPRSDNWLRSASWHLDIFPPRPWTPPRHHSWLSCANLAWGSQNNIVLCVLPGCARAIQLQSRMHFSSHTLRNASQTGPHYKVFLWAPTRVGM